MAADNNLPQHPHPSVQKFCQLLADSFVAVLTQLGVAEVRGSSIFSSQESVAQPTSAVGVSARFAGGGALRGEILCHARNSAGLQLAQTLMAEPLQPDAAFADDQKDAFAEMVRQTAGLVATEWKKITSAETILNFHSAVEPVFPPSPSSQLTLSGANFPDVPLQLWLTSSLIQALESQTVAVPVSEGPKSAAVAAAPAAPSTSATEPFLSGGNLDLLLDVELEATIRFGEREMFLRDVLGLLPGAVVELNQVVNEPADLLVAGRLVARGEVVVVDGNFGLRVTEVASRSQRASLVPF